MSPPSRTRMLVLSRGGARQDPHLRLVCFPYAGGSPWLFRPWPAHLPPEIEVCTVEWPGRGARWNEAPVGSLTELVDITADALAPYLDTPFAIFGHSMGALVGFELVRALGRRGRTPPVELFVSGYAAPQTGRTGASSRLLHPLPDRELIAEVQKLNGIPDPVLQNPELIDLMLPPLRADFRVIETYQYEHDRPLDCPITAFGGADDPLVRPHRLAAWHDQTTAMFSFRIFPGDHFFIHQAQAALLAELSRRLATRISEDDRASDVSAMIGATDG